MGTTIEQYQSRNDCHNNKAKDAFSRVRERLLEYDAYDVLLKCSLFANIKSWMLQVVESGDVLVYTKDVL